MVLLKKYLLASLRVQTFTRADWSLMLPLMFTRCKVSALISKGLTSTTFEAVQSCATISTLNLVDLNPADGYKKELLLSVLESPEGGKMYCMKAESLPYTHISSVNSCFEIFSDFFSFFLREEFPITSLCALTAPPLTKRTFLNVLLY